MIVLRAIACVVLLDAASLSAPAEAAGKKKTTASETYVDIASVAASVVQDFEVRSVLHVEAGLEIADDKLRAKAERLLPRLRAACADALRAYAGDQYAYGAAPDAERIAMRLQAAVDRALGQEGAQVLLSMVIVHNAER